MAKDPVCGMHVDETSARYKSEHDGREYFFCCEGCQRSFEESPDKFLAEDTMGHEQGDDAH